MNASSRRKTPRFVGMLEAAVFLAAVVPVLGLFGRAFWLFDLFSHFRLQYIAFFISAGILFLLLRRGRAVLFCGVGVLLLALPLAPYYFPLGNVAHERPIKAISFNVNSANTNYDAIRKFLSAESADVILIMEVNPEFDGEMAELRGMYPYRREFPMADNFGIAVFSKHPFAVEEVHFFDEFRIPYLEFEVVIDGENYRFLGVHTFPPAGKMYSAVRNAELFDIAGDIAKRGRGSVILMGDFNMTPFSPYFSEVLGVSGLRNSMPGFGIQTTWMSASWIFAIPIDHVLVSDNLTVMRRTIGDPCGSDHNPVIVELAKRK